MQFFSYFINRKTCIQQQRQLLRKYQISHQIINLDLEVFLTSQSLPLGTHRVRRTPLNTIWTLQPIPTSFPEMWKTLEIRATLTIQNQVSWKNCLGMFPSSPSTSLCRTGGAHAGHHLQRHHWMERWGAKSDTFHHWSSIIVSSNSSRTK